MVSEMLSIPEEDLPDVVAVIRAGLNEVPVPTETKERLSEWCDEIEKYLDGEAI